MIDVKPRVREGRYLAHFAHAMIDTSDGLADACHLLSELSGVRLLLEESRIPWARGLERVSLARESRRRTTAFYGGDYELLAAIPKSAWSRVRRTPGVGVTVVGRVERGRGAMLLTRGGSVELPPAGWQPFGAPVRRRKAPPGENV